MRRTSDSQRSSRKPTSKPSRARGSGAIIAGKRKRPPAGSFRLAASVPPFPRQQISIQFRRSTTSTTDLENKMSSFGMVGLDWQERINWDRLRKYRLERAREKM